jgi:site-specific DNA recombinase
MAGEAKVLRSAIYTRKSTEHGLELEFNSLDAQRDACEAYIKSQTSQGWRALPQHYVRSSSSTRARPKQSEPSSTSTWN